MGFVPDFKDINIRWKGHPKFKSTKVIEDDIVETIVQKLEMLLFTNRKEVLGDDGFFMGLDLEYYLWETKISNNILLDKIKKQKTQMDTMAFAISKSKEKEALFETIDKRMGAIVKST